MSKYVNIEVFRYDPEKDKEPYYETYSVEIRKKGMLMLEALNQIKGELDTLFPLRNPSGEVVGVSKV